VVTGARSGDSKSDCGTGFGTTVTTVTTKESITYGIMTKYIIQRIYNYVVYYVRIEGDLRNNPCQPMTGGDFNVFNGLAGWLGVTLSHFYHTFIEKSKIITKIAIIRSLKDIVCSYNAFVWACFIGASVFICFGGLSTLRGFWRQLAYQAVAGLERLYRQVLRAVCLVL
jgi:hypothetical protein